MIIPFQPIHPSPAAYAPLPVLLIPGGPEGDNKTLQVVDIARIGLQRQTVIFPVMAVAEPVYRLPEGKLHGVALPDPPDTVIGLEDIFCGKKAAP